ncbi:MAG: MFS transporter [Chloroflexi bacterium]|nr:MFS transporter [Chloroflexota bacterium]
MPAKNSPPLRVLISIGVGTGLSLLGDSALYTVLPTHTADANVTFAAVGILLSANRWIRLLLNGPMGLAYDRWRRKPIFVTALFLGALSTAIYGATQGFWPLLFGRLLWGLAWAGIWVGGNTILLDLTDDSNRGRWVGMYQIAFFLGAASGAFTGGLLTDLIGFAAAMKLQSGLALFGALFALAFLPDTRAKRLGEESPPTDVRKKEASQTTSQRKQFAYATALHGVNRLVIPGMLTATFGLFLAQQLGDPVQFGERSMGVATLTGIGLGLATLISMLSAPISGILSDRAISRWKIVARGLLPGIAGFGLLAVGSPPTIALGLPLTAFTSGSNQGLSTTLAGDLGSERKRGRRLGVLFTVGDLMSAIGPILAFGLIPLIRISGLYSIAALLYGLMFILAMRMTRSNLARVV